VKTTRRIEITVETAEVFIVRRRGAAHVAPCTACCEPSGMLPAEEAARMTGVSWREISRRVEAGRVHFVETPDGRLLICVNSLFQ